MSTNLENGTGRHTGASALDLPVSVTFFVDQFASQKTDKTISLRALVPRIRDTVRTTKGKLPWLKLARFGDIRTEKKSLRHDGNVLEIQGVEADYDGEQITLARARQVLTTAGIAAVLYTSPGHTEDKPRWRVLCPTSKPYPPSERSRFLARVNGLFVGALSSESFVLSQSYFYGRIATSTSHEVITIEGAAIDLAADLDENAIGKPEKPKIEPVYAPAVQLGRPTGCSAYGMVVLESECNNIRTAGEGAKHPTLNKAAYSVGGLVPDHMPEHIAKAALQDALGAIASRCADYEAAKKTLEAAFSAGMAKPRNVPAPRYEQRPAPQARYADTPDENGEYVRLDEPDTLDEPPGLWEEMDVIEPVQPISVDHPRNGDLPITYFDDIKPSVETADFLEGVLIENSAAVIYGESNSGKTFFATDMALHVACGRKWRDREVEQGGVVYVALEGGIGFNNRIEAWRREMDDDVRVTFAAITVPINLLDPEADTERLIVAIRAAAKRFEMPVKLVVIDTLSRAMAGGNENAPDDMGALVMNMDRVRDATKCAVMFVHHSGKDQAKGARGHSLLRAAIDTEIEVVADGKSRTATVVKQRELEGDSAFPFTLKVVTLGENKRGKPVTSCVVEGSSSGHTAGAVPRVKLKGHPRRALEVLHDLLIESGKEGFQGVPLGYLSVPEDWWRKRFYDRTISDGKEEITQNAKRMAFNRACEELLDKHLIGVMKGRVWAVRSSDTPAQTPAQKAAQYD